MDVNPGYNWKNCDVFYVSITITAVFLIAMLVSIISESPLHQNTAIAEAYAQPYVETVKNRNLTIDLDNGLKTNAQLTFPAIGKGPYPGVIIFPGAGAGSVITPSYSKVKYYGHLAEYLAERGYAVLKYDKRGVGPYLTISDSNAWGNLTFDNLKHDAEKALSVLLQQPEVNATKKVTLIGHSEGTNFPPRIAAENPDKVRNIVLMAPVAEKWTDIIYFQEVANPILYAENILDKDHPGQISVAEASKDPIFQKLVGGNLTQLLLNPTNVTDNNGTGILPEQKNNTNDDLISIEGVLKPALVRGYENDTSPNASQLSEKCIDIYGCPSLGKSFSALPSVIGMIGNVSSNIGVLILEGQNDSQTPLQQALLLQQRLTEANHPDHQIIVYPDLGHNFIPSNQWVSSGGPQMEEYVLQDIYEWLSSPLRQK
ncbi:MAG: alpha/beta fold hydrolase [Candidatus Nitrosocosmicus sp.]|nr:alpha/beta fold hydrolase [Candidatus Nitrosocosmicus sp.]